MNQGQPGRQEAQLQTEHRRYNLIISQERISSAMLIENRGYVALAVATEKGTFTRELSTGLGGDREANMVQFAVEALSLLKDVIKGDAKL